MKNIYRVIICLMVLADINESVLAQSFGTATNVAVGTRPRSLYVADVNLDGKLDIITVNQNSENVSVRLGNGTGGFTGTTTIGIGGAGSNPYSLSIADVNLDGKPDLLVGLFTSDSVAVRLGNGAGGFSGTFAIKVGANPRNIVIADLNNDGKPDMLTANLSSNNVSVCLGNGTGNFTLTSTINVGTSPAGIAVADVNRDGKPDFLTANDSSNTVSVRLGNGLGGFSGSTNVAVGSRPQSLVVADVNSDGNLDFLVSNLGNNTVSVRLGNGAGGFSGTTNVSVGSGPQSVFVGDLNVDGKLDFVTANFNNFVNTVSVRTGDGIGGFSGTTDLSVGNGPFSVFIADVSNDARPDILVANTFGDNVSVLLNTTPITLNPFGSATRLSVGTAPRGVAIADVSLDGKPDIVTANQSSNNISIRLGNGAGGFANPTQISVGNSPQNVVVSDVNLDGRPDVLTVNQQSNSVSVRLLDGDFENSSGLVEVSVASIPSNMVVADVNLDGKPDILSLAVNSTVSVRLGDGLANFSGTTEISGFSLPNNLAVADINLDGKPDLLVSGGLGTFANVALRFGDGTGNFTGTTSVSVGLTPRGIAVADVNLDGKPDILTANQGGNSVSVRLGDGTGQFSGTTEIAVDGSPQVVRVADFNLDGKPDFVSVNLITNGTVSVRYGDGTGNFTGTVNIPVGTSTAPVNLAVGDINMDARPDIVTANTVSNNVSVILNNVLAVSSAKPEADERQPSTFFLEQNYPNPFNPSTTIAYQLPATSVVSLKVYDLLGREVATLVNARQTAGSYQATFNASNFSSGMYVYQLVAGTFTQTKKMVLVK